MYHNGFLRNTCKIWDHTIIKLPNEYCNTKVITSIFSLKLLKAVV